MMATVELRGTLRRSGGGSLSRNLDLIRGSPRGAKEGGLGHIDVRILSMGLLGWLGLRCEEDDEDMRRDDDVLPWPTNLPTSVWTQEPE